MFLSAVSVKYLLHEAVDTCLLHCTCKVFKSYFLGVSLYVNTVFSVSCCKSCLLNIYVYVNTFLETGIANFKRFEGFSRCV